jgi:hypothetical protein
MTSVYKIGVNLAMTSNASGVLSVISKQILGLDASVATLQKSLGRIGPALTAGLAAVAASGVIATLKTATDYGKELLDQQDKLIRGGVTHAQVAKLTASAYQSIAYAVPTADGADILKTIGELRTVTGSLDRAVAAAPLALKAQSLLENTTGTDDDSAGFKLWRAIEMKGLTAGTPAMQSLGEKLIETFIQTISGAGGKLTANDYQMMAKRAGAYWIHADPKFLAGPMSVVAADMGGDAAGTVMATFGQFLQGATTISRQQFDTLSRLGLIDRRKVSGDLGGRVNMQPGAIAGSLQYGGDYFGWVQNELLPALKAAGVKPGPEKDSILAKIGRNRNATRMLQMFSDPGFVAQIQKDIAIWNKGMLPDKAYADYIKNDPKGVDAAFSKQYQSMMQAIGAPLEQAAIPVMSAVTSMFTSIGAFAQKHPNIVKEAGFDLVLGPLAAVVDTFRALGGVLQPVGKAMSAIPGEAQQVETAISKLTGVFNPVAGAANNLAGSIEHLGASIGSAIGSIASSAWKGVTGSWASGAAPNYSRNGIHKESFISPAISPSNGASLIRADAVIPAISAPQAADIHKMQMAQAVVVPRLDSKVTVPLQIEMKVDGKVLSKIVTKRQTQLATLPLGIHGAPDSYGSYVGPGTTFQNA